MPKIPERFATIHEASDAIGESLDDEQTGIAIFRASCLLMPVEFFSVSIIDEETKEIKTITLADENKSSPRIQSAYGQRLRDKVISSGQPLVHQGTRMPNIPSEDLNENLSVPVSYLAVPMKWNGRTVGVISVQSPQPDAYAEKDMHILSILANLAAMQIISRQLINEDKQTTSDIEQRLEKYRSGFIRERKNTETLLRILTEISSTLDLDGALDRTLSVLNESIGAEQSTILLVHAEDNLLHYRAGHGYSSDRSASATKGFTLKIGEGLAGWVVKHREAVLIGDLSDDQRWVRSTATGQDHRSAIAVPMSVGEDAIGVLMVFHRMQNFFIAELLNLVTAIAGQVAVAINNARLYELIRDQAERLGLMLRKEQVETSRSQAILEAVADGVLVTSANNRISFVNSSITRILGVSDSQLLGQSLEGFAGLFGSFSVEWIKTIRRWSEDPSTHQVGEMYADHLELETGHIVLIHLAPVILVNDFLGTVSIFRDITREVEVDRLKSEFVASVSHELRTPLTAIRGYSEIIISGAAGKLNRNQGQFLNVMKDNIDRLSILIGDLLDISRIESGRVTLAQEAIDLREIAENVIEDLLRRTEEDGKSMAISLDAPKSVPMVHGDPSRLRQVIDNLVYNSYHYTPENGNIIISIHSSEDDDEIQIDIIDNGIGIPPEDQSRVFERFYRGEHPLVLSVPGTGLGLPIVRQLVEMHKGRVWMKSTGVPGEGSIFSFTLPAYKASS